jgi:alpha-D-ribose 1-methylphosphonate 5-phosphate C-P lyase
MSNTLVCPKCCGNGYINLFIKNDEGKEKAIAMDCDYCNNQGEVEITEKVIKKLEEDKGVN